MTTGFISLSTQLMLAIIMVGPNPVPLPVRQATAPSRVTAAFICLLVTQ
jgi:hypothetical protein